MRTTTYPLEAKIKMNAIPRFGKYTEQMKCTYIAPGEENGTDALENNLTISYKCGHVITMHPSNPHPKYLPKQK